MVDLDTLKMVIRGLVVSNPRIMTIESLCRDYRMSEGHVLPFRQLGFASAVDLLFALKDTIRLSGNTVHVVSSEETAHLESLIARQKKGKRKGRPSSGFHQKTVPSKQYLPTKFRNPSSNYSSCRNLSYSGSSYYGQASSRIQPSVTQTSYRREENRGFRNEEVRSRSPEDNRRPARYNEEEESDYNSEKEEHYNQFEVVTPSNGKDFELRCTNDVMDSACDPVRDSLYVKAGNEAEDLTFGTVDVDSLMGLSPTRNCSRATVKYYRKSDDDDSISPRMKRNLREIIQAYPSGLRCARLPEEYLRRFGVTLDCRECGYVSVNQMAMSLPDVFRCVPIHSGDWMLFDASQPPPEQFLCNDDEYAPQVSGRILERISSILSTKCRGVNLNDFSVNYMILYGSPLLDHVEAFETMEELFRSLSNSKLVVVREVKGELMVYPPSAKESDPNNEALPIELTWEEIRSTLPPTACKPDEKCPQITLSKKIVFGNYLVVRLGEIYSPGKFWIHLYGHDHSAKLDALMDEMQSFYRENKRKYFVPSANWKRGQHCVALYANEWHRAEILSIVDKHQVKLKYFDYGTIGTVKKADIRLLDKQFVSLPVMAIKAKLSAIKPAKGQKDWSPDANQYFFSLIDKKLLVASVVKILHDLPFLAVALVNTESGDDVHINDLLVENGFAEFTIDESDSEWSDEAVEPDHVEAEEVRKRPTDVNTFTNDITNEPKLTPRTQEPASSEGSTKVSHASAIGDTRKSSKLSDKNSFLNRDRPTSTAEIVSSCIKDVVSSNLSQAITPAEENSVPSASNSAPPGIVPTAHPLPNSSSPSKTCRPPPGFSAIGPMKAPPGLSRQGPNIFGTNNGLQHPNAGHPNLTPLVPPNVMYLNMVNPLAFNRLPFNQMPLNNGLHYPQFNGYSPMIAQQMLMTSMSQNLPPIEGWPVNVANSWNPQFNNGSYNPFMFRQPLADNNPALRPQYPPRQNQPYPNQLYPSQLYPMKPASGTPFINNNIVVPKKTEEKIPEPSSTRKRKTIRESEVNPSLPVAADVAKATESTPFLAEMTLDTPSLPPPPSPLPPPGLTPPPTPPPVEAEPVKKSGNEGEVRKLSAELSEMTVGEETSSSEDLLKEDYDDCYEDKSVSAMVGSRPQSPIPQVDYYPLFDEEPDTPKIERESSEEGSDLAEQPRLLWKPLDVGVGVIHLLNFNGEAHVSSDELSRVCLQMNGHEEFVKTLESKSFTDTVFEYRRKDHEEFFNSLDLCPGLKEIMSFENEFPQTYLNLIPLKKVVGALIAAGIKVPKVVFAFQNARRMFNPNDDYWQQICENPSVISKSGEESLPA